ncbi:MAG: hypothetical protein Q8O86_13625 [Dehalococcoidia bacterium]|nr:hypothetical protein [Dehalococcoidia bacterium]
MSNWLAALNGDPLPWLLEDNTPAVQHMALRLLLDRSPDDPAVRQARAAAMRTGPIAAILGAQNPGGYWLKPGPGYGPKYTGTVWQLVFLDQMGADGTDQRIQAALCRGEFQTRPLPGPKPLEEDSGPRPSLVVDPLRHRG